MTVDCKSDICIKSGPAGFASEEKRSSDPGIDECLFEGVITLSEQRGAHSAHDVKRSGQGRLILSRYAEINLQSGCM